MSKWTKVLDKARKAKNDEFYTQYKDIEKEVSLHKDCFKNKVVYCPCDDWEKSQFVKFFLDHFKEYKLKELIATSYPKGKVLITTLNYCGFLEGDGDFRSCGDFFEKADFVVTNPPFSLFKDFFECIKNKNFLVLGPVNAITYKNIFPWIKENKVWTTSTTKHVFFKVPNGGYKELKNVRWFTNFDRVEKPFVELIEKYTPEKYLKYDNCEAIEAKSIPCDYDGVIGVPVTFLDKYNPYQFEIVGYLGNPFINGAAIYKRILIRRLKIAEQQ